VVPGHKRFWGVSCAILCDFTYLLVHLTAAWNLEMRDSYIPLLAIRSDIPFNFFWSVRTPTTPTGTLDGTSGICYSGNVRHSAWLYWHFIRRSLLAELSTAARTHQQLCETDIHVPIHRSQPNKFLDQDTGLQALPTLLLLLLLLVLRLFHFTTDRRQNLRTDRRQHYPQSHRDRLYS